MTDGNSINIGGVRFDKQSVQTSEVVQKDGQQMNSVFLNDGTQVVYPNQDAKKEATINQSFEINMVDIRRGPQDHEKVWVENKDKATTTFNNLENAQITGTDKKDNYKLNGCKDIKVDISQDDNKKDKVTINKTSSNVTVDSMPNDKVKTKK